MHVDAGALQGTQVFRGDVLMVERQDVQAAGKLKEVVQVGVITDRGVGHGRDGRDVLTFGKDAELEAQGSGRRGHHSGELAAANHTDHRKSHKSQPTESLAISRLLDFPCGCPGHARFPAGGQARAVTAGGGFGLRSAAGGPAAGAHPGNRR